MQVVWWTNYLQPFEASVIIMLRGKKETELIEVKMFISQSESIQVSTHADLITTDSRVATWGRKVQQ